MTVFFKNILTLGKVIIALENWCNANEMIINKKKNKTEILFRNLKGKRTYPTVCKGILTTKLYKYLGIYVDRNMNLTEHLSKMKIHINMTIANINKPSPKCITVDNKLLLYVSLIFSKLRYGSPLLQLTTKSTKDKWSNLVRNSLKKALRIKKNTKNRLIEPLTSRLDILQISEIRLERTKQNITLHRRKSPNKEWEDAQSKQAEIIISEADSLFRKEILDWELIKLINKSNKYPDRTCRICQNKTTLNLGHLKLHHKPPPDDTDDDVETMIKKIMRYAAFNQASIEENPLEILKLKKICREYLTTWELCRNRDEEMEQLKIPRKPTRDRSKPVG